MAENHRTPGHNNQNGPASDGSILARKLSSHAELSQADWDAILDLPIRVKTYEADQEIVHDGDRPTECGVVLEGFAFRHKMVIDGRRQIMSFHPAGDMPDLQSMYLRTMDHGIGALVRTKMGFISHRVVEELARSRKSINTALWREALIDAAVTREWMIGLGRRSAYERMAHLLCEMALRLEAVGLSSRNEFRFPATQMELADALGLSTVHANRIIQELRRSHMITWRGAVIAIRDWDGLCGAAGFDPAYLHRLTILP